MRVRRSSERTEPSAAMSVSPAMPTRLAPERFGPGRTVAVGTLRPKPNRFAPTLGRMPVTLFALCLGYLMVIVDATAVNVALPDLRHDLGTTVSGLQWIVDAYTLAFAALLLTGGALGDRLGGRRVLLAGLALFTAASVLCGLAPTTGVLVAARALQGVGAALAVPASLAL